MRLPPARATIAIAAITALAWGAAVAAGQTDRIAMLAGFIPARVGGLEVAGAGRRDDGDADLEPDDRLLLCSDGLTDLVDDDTIAEAIRTDEPIERRADALVNEAMSRGGKDNVTLVKGPRKLTPCGATES